MGSKMPDYQDIWGGDIAPPDNQPILGDISTGGPLLFYNIWQYAKYSWHTAKSNPPAPELSQLTPYLASVTNIDSEEAHFRG